MEYNGDMHLSHHPPLSSKDPDPSLVLASSFALFPPHGRDTGRHIRKRELPPLVGIPEGMPEPQLISYKGSIRVVHLLPHNCKLTSSP
jgi:hypothetical protein